MSFRIILLKPPIKMGDYWGIFLSDINFPSRARFRKLERLSKLRRIQLRGTKNFIIWSNIQGPSLDSEEMKKFFLEMVFLRVWKIIFQLFICSFFLLKSLLLNERLHFVMDISRKILKNIFQRWKCWSGSTCGIPFTIDDFSYKYMEWI